MEITWTEIEGILYPHWDFGQDLNFRDSDDLVSSVSVRLSETLDGSLFIAEELTRTTTHEVTYRKTLISLALWNVKNQNLVTLVSITNVEEET
jgi:hypothetical protein